MASRTKLAVVLTRGEAPLEQQIAEAARLGADVVELRVDLIGDVAAVERVLRGPRTLPIILTVRSSAEGGAFDGDEAERVALIERLGLLGPGYVDFELAAWERSANVRQKVGLVCRLREEAVGSGGERSKNELILSWHDFRETPADLDAVFQRLERSPAGVIKAVFTARDVSDALRVLAQVGRCTHRQRESLPYRAEVIGLAMGAAGVASRVLARKVGAWLTFASLEAGAESAAGQVTIDQMRGLYRWDAIGPATRVYGVIGWPVEHSRSPQIHNAAMAAAGVDGVFVPLAVEPTQAAFERFMAQVEAEPQLDLYGFSVTLPHKEHALAWLKRRGAEVSPLARACGAVNTLIREDAAEGARWSGDNTDASGFLAALRAGPYAGRDSLRGVQAAVLGAGGVARAIVATLVDAGAAVTVFNRTPQRAAQLAAEFGCLSAPWSERPGRPSREDGRPLLVVNCTQVGMSRSDDPGAVEETPLPAGVLRAGWVVFDTIYTPGQTRLLREAAAAGCVPISGVEMFVAQAEAQFARWHGSPPPAGVMREALKLPD